MATSVIIVSYRRHPWLAASIASVVDEADEVIVVDNGSPGGSIGDEAQDLGAIAVRLPTNTGLPAGVNAGIRAARGTTIALLNDDAFAVPGWLGVASRALEDRTVGAVSPKIVFQARHAEFRLPDVATRISGDPRPLGRQLLTATVDGEDVLDRLRGPGIHRLEHGDAAAGPSRWRWTTGPEPILLPLDAAATHGADGTTDPPPVHELVLNGEVFCSSATHDVINNAGSYLSAFGYSGDYGYEAIDDGSFDEPAERFGACGAAIVTTTDVLDRVGLLPAEFFAYYEDTDWSWRVRAAGLAIRYEPTAVVRHVGGATSGGPGSAWVQSLALRNRLLCLARNAPLDVARSELRKARHTHELPKVVRSLALPLPRALAQRRMLRARRTVAPAATWARWAGVDERWPGQRPA